MWPAEKRYIYDILRSIDTRIYIYDRFVLGSIPEHVCTPWGRPLDGTHQKKYSTSITHARSFIDTTPGFKGPRQGVTWDRARPQRGRKRGGGERQRAHASGQGEHKGTGEGRDQRIKRREGREHDVSTSPKSFTASCGFPLLVCTAVGR